MVNQFLLNILITVAAIDLLIGGIYVVFLVNARMILKNQFFQRRFEIKTILAAQQASSSDDAAKHLGLTTEEFIAICSRSGIDTPEERIAKKEEAERIKQEELRRISEEEAIWRAEQEKMAEQIRLEQEEEASKRRERLRKFGMV